jgi:hypothetical protein
LNQNEVVCPNFLKNKTNFRNISVIFFRAGCLALHLLAAVTSELNSRSDEVVGGGCALRASADVAGRWRKRQMQSLGKSVFQHHVAARYVLVACLDPLGIMPAVSKKPSTAAAVAASPSKQADAAAKPSPALIAISKVVRNVAPKGGAVASGPLSSTPCLVFAFALFPDFFHLTSL